MGSKPSKPRVAKLPPAPDPEIARAEEAARLRERERRRHMRGRGATLLGGAGGDAQTSGAKLLTGS